MTKDHKIQLLHFIVRTPMFIVPQDKNNIVSFLHGYEYGDRTSNLSALLKDFLTRKFNIPEVSTGWPGQIERLARRQAQHWVRTLKQVILELITEAGIEDLKEALDETIKRRVQALIERLDPKGHPRFNEDWPEEWQILCVLNFEWFNHLWTPEELSAIQAIDKAVAAQKIFSDHENTLPTAEMAQLKEQFFSVHMKK
jgi:hypothetical protein